MKTEIVDLSLFGREEEKERAVKPSQESGRAPAAHRQKAGGKPADPDKAARFQELIRGEYKEEFSRAVEAIVRRRLKGEKSASSELAALRAEQSEKNRRLRAAAAQKQAARWQQELAELKEAYPGFTLEEEMRNPAFTALLTRREHPLTMRGAYEALHFQELRGDIEREAERRVLEALRSRAARPTENGAAAQGGMPFAAGHMSRKKRAELARRAARGETITF